MRSHHSLLLYMNECKYVVLTASIKNTCEILFTFIINILFLMTLMVTLMVYYLLTFIYFIFFWQKIQSILNFRSVETVIKILQSKKISLPIYCQVGSKGQYFIDKYQFGVVIVLTTPCKLATSNFRQLIFIRRSYKNQLPIKISYLQQKYKLCISNGGTNEKLYVHKQEKSC